MEKLKKDFFFGNIVLKNFINLDDEEKEITRTLRNNELVREWCYHEHIISTGEHIPFIENLKKDNSNFYWLVKRNDEFIGVISLNRVDFENKNSYLGIYSNFKIRKVGDLLIDCLKKVTFEVANLHTLKLEVIEDNKKALNLYKKAGFKKEGELKDFVFKNGRYKKVILMGIINNNENRNSK